MEGTCQSIAQQMMERLHDSLSTPINLPGGTQITIRASMGMAVYSDTTNTMADLIAKADQAMYQDKNSCKPSAAPAWSVLG
jgi:diguanylate cyclase (GGDEF)-like protein